MLSGSCHKRPSLDKFLLPRKPLKKKKKNQNKDDSSSFVLPRNNAAAKLWPPFIKLSQNLSGPFHVPRVGAIDLLCFCYSLAAWPGPSRDPNSPLFSCACPLLPLSFLLNGSWRNRREEPARRVSESATITIRHCNQIALPTPRKK